MNIGEQPFLWDGLLAGICNRSNLRFASEKFTDNVGDVGRRYLESKIKIEYLKRIK